MKIRFIHTPKPRRFNHVNIYYDPEAEARADREERVRKELGIKADPSEFRTSIKRGTFRRLHNQGQEDPSADTRAERLRSNIRFALIAAVLVILAIVLYATSGDFLAM